MEENFDSCFRSPWVFFFDSIPKNFDPVPKLDSGGFLKVACIVESETISMNFFSHYMKIHLSVLHFE